MKNKETESYSTSLVITTAGKRVPQLDKLLDDIGKKDDPFMEVVVVNDSGSQLPITSNTKFREIWSSAKSPFGALVDGVVSSCSKYVAQQNDDDPYVCERLGLQLDKLTKSEKKFSVCPILKTTHFSIPVSSLQKPISYEFYQTLLLLFGAYGSDASLIFDAKYFLSTNPSEFSHLAMADWAWGLANMFDSNTCASNKAKYIYIQHSNQITRTKIYSKYIAFSEIYPYWAKRNKIERLPNLTLNEAFLISIGSLSDVKVESITCVLEWLKVFQERWFEKIHVSDLERKILSDFLSRKQILIFIGQRAWLKLFRYSVTKPRLSLQMVFEIFFILLSRTARA